MDGDGQHNVNDVVNMLNVMHDTSADMVIGSRYINNEGFQSSFLRRLGIDLLSLIVKVKTGKTICDITSGFRMVNRNIIELYAAYYPFDFPEPESTTQIMLDGKTVVECPVIMRERVNGKSSIK